MAPRDHYREASPAVPVEGSCLLDVAGAATYLGVTQPFVRRLVLERRIRYFKLGKFVRFRTADLDAFIEAGRQEPVAPWVHTRSTLRRTTTRNPGQQLGPSRPARQATGRATKDSGR